MPKARCHLRRGVIRIDSFLLRAMDAVRSLPIFLCFGPRDTAMVFTGTNYIRNLSRIEINIVMKLTYDPNVLDEQWSTGQRVQRVRFRYSDPWDSQSTYRFR